VKFVDRRRPDAEDEYNDTGIEKTREKKGACGIEREGELRWHWKAQ
jgi:hypothetical protein